MNSIDCDICGMSIGTEENPMCITPEDLILCKSCFIKEERREPTDLEKEYT